MGQQLTNTSESFWAKILVCSPFRDHLSETHMYIKLQSSHCLTVETLVSDQLLPSVP